ncbi:MAG: hypothetical protein KGJ91_02930, partial [Xanthomonadaceae bacterium]|nr:hypothetical protein [Xanthomonadaceae bacterium]
SRACSQVCKSGSSVVAGSRIMLRTLALAALRDWPFSDDSAAGFVGVVAAAAAAAAPRIDGYAPG